MNAAQRRRLEREDKRALFSLADVVTMLEFVGVSGFYVARFRELARFIYNRARK